jgi:hypothetical protein
MPGTPARKNRRDHTKPPQGDHPVIKPVYRVQCDGPGEEWLALPEHHTPGTDLVHADLIAAPTAEHAGMWPGEKEATRAAIGAGWRHPVDSKTFKDWLCPGCQTPPKEQQ